MSKLPPFLKFNDDPPQSVCLVLEGYEEWYYFERLKKLNVFSPKYNIKLINAKSASNIPAKYQEALNSNSHSIVLIVCDMDRVPKSYEELLVKLKAIIGNDDGSNDVEVVVTFTRPCTLQIILLHFGQVTLLTQAKRAARVDVKCLTGVENYDAHENQLEAICNQIYRRTWDEMLNRLSLISKNQQEIPSTNIDFLFTNLSSNDAGWIDEINKQIL